MFIVVVVYFVIHSVRILLDTPFSNSGIYHGRIACSGLEFRTGRVTDAVACCGVRYGTVYDWFLTVIVLAGVL